MRPGTVFRLKTRSKPVKVRLAGKIVFQSQSVLRVGSVWTGFGGVFSLKLVSDRVSETRCSVIIIIIMFLARDDEHTPWYK
jgi:hypothetical protein